MLGAECYDWVSGEEVAASGMPDSSAYACAVQAGQEQGQEA